MKKLKSVSVFLFAISWFMAGFVRAEVNIITDDIYELAMDNIGISNGDLKKYKNIFKALDKGDFKTVDSLAEKLDSQALWGYVLAEKYLHPYFSIS